MKYLNKNLRYLKLKQNAKIREISEYTGLNLASIHRVFSQEDLSNVTIKTVSELSEYFDVSIDDLVNTDLESKERSM